MITRAIHEWLNENLPDLDYNYGDVRDIVFGTLNDRQDDIVWIYEEKTMDARIESIGDYVEDVLEDELDSFIENLPWM